MDQLLNNGLIVERTKEHCCYSQIIVLFITKHCLGYYFEDWLTLQQHTLLWVNEYNIKQLSFAAMEFYDFHFRSWLLSLKFVD